MDLKDELAESESPETMKFLYGENCDIKKARLEVRAALRCISPLATDFFAKIEQREIEIEIKKELGKLLGKLYTTGE